MKKIFPNGIKNSGLWTLGSGLIRNATGFGAAKTGVIATIDAAVSVAETFRYRKDKNKASLVGGEGKTDWYEIIGMVIGTIVFLIILGWSAYQLFTGQITLEEFKDINQ